VQLDGVSHQSEKISPLQIAKTNSSVLSEALSGAIGIINVSQSSPRLIQRP